MHFIGRLIGFLPTGKVLLAFLACGHSEPSGTGTVSSCLICTNATRDRLLSELGISTNSPEIGYATATNVDTLRSR